MAPSTREPAIVTDILARYRTLCEYCDAFFARVRAAAGEEVRCREGCSDCCELQSVVALEAHGIEQALVAERRHVPPAWNRTGRGCVLLREGRCGIYDRRPLICRTHGLLVQEEDTVVRTCPKNFTRADAAMVDAGLVFDSERITANLIRLNYAFCAAGGAPEQAGRRIPIRDLLARTADTGRSG